MAESVKSLLESGRHWRVVNPRSGVQRAPQYEGATIIRRVVAGREIKSRHPSNAAISARADPHFNLRLAGESPPARLFQNDCVLRRKHAVPCRLEFREIRVAGFFRDNAPQLSACAGMARALPSAHVAPLKLVLSACGEMRLPPARVVARTSGEAKREKAETEAMK